MPQIIETIDRIARIKQRDVLFLSFYDGAVKERVHQATSEDGFEAWQAWQDHRHEVWEKLPIRQQIIDWLNAKGITWQPCAAYIPGLVVLSGYCGDIYLDVPYDKTLPIYQELETYLQYDDDRMRYEHVWFFCLSLQEAMKNAKQDEPGFFDNM